MIIERRGGEIGGGVWKDCFGVWRSIWGLQRARGCSAFGTGFEEVYTGGESDKARYLDRMSMSPFFKTMTGKEKEDEIEKLVREEEAGDGSREFVQLVVNAMRDGVGKEWFWRWRGRIVGSSVEHRNRHYFSSRYLWKRGGIKKHLSLELLKRCDIPETA